MTIPIDAKISHNQLVACIKNIVDKPRKSIGQKPLKASFYAATGFGYYKFGDERLFHVSLMPSKFLNGVK